MEAWNDLNQSHINGIARGGKGKERERIGELIECGDEIARLIDGAIENEDQFCLKENIEGISENTKKLLLASLQQDAQDKMSIMMGND